ncbi:MAG: hypothetical protein PPP58_09325 [Natronomonas sp.]
MIEQIIVGPGTWLIFGVILVPVYAVLAAWYLGDPSDSTIATMGVGYLVGFTLLLWTGLFLKTVVIDLLFF